MSSSNSATNESIESEDVCSVDQTVKEQNFDPNQCLFCNKVVGDLDHNVSHMYKEHGLAIPDQNRLLVDLETLLAYIHLIIFGYCECLYCGMQRSTAEAAQHHMTARRHCRWDILKEDSEFLDFYGPASGDEHEGEEEEEKEENDSLTSASLVQPDSATLRLPSGKILSHRNTRASRALPRPRTDQNDNRRTQVDAGLAPTPQPAQDETSPSTALTKADRRETTLATQLTRLRAEDRRSLMHLPSSQQRAVIATHKRQLEKARNIERAMQGRVEAKGNKTLMKHFVPDVPGRSNG